MLEFVTADTNAPVVHVAGILRNAGLTSLELTRAETICAEETPGIGWDTFRQTFGSGSLSEWPKCSRKSGYEDFLCTNASIQLFMPIDAGKPGLVLRLPIVAGLSQNEKSTFHVLTTMTQGRTLHYRGKYAKIPLPQLQFKWENLSHQVCVQNLLLVSLMSLVQGTLDQTGTDACHACSPCSN
jgi:hypothetical protein